MFFEKKTIAPRLADPFGMGRVEARKRAILKSMNASELADIGLKPADIAGL